jgi:hypothetical protein
VGRRNAIADGLDALTAAAKAVRGLRAPAAERARSNTLSALVTEIRQVKAQIQKIEMSFAAVSRFATEVTTRFEAIEKRIEQLARPQLEAQGHDRG